MHSFYNTNIQIFEWKDKCMINQFIVTFNHLLKMLILNGDMWNFNIWPFSIFDYGKHSSRSQVNAVPRNSSIYAYFILYIISPSNISYSVWKTAMLVHRLCKINEIDWYMTSPFIGKRNINDKWIEKPKFKLNEIVSQN